MKKLVTIFALTASVIMGPAFAASSVHTARHAHAHIQSSDTYTFDGKAVGQDPDPFIRQQAVREAESGGANR
jgi:hypothetical protein